MRGGLLQELTEPKFRAQTLSMKLTATPFATGAARSLLKRTALSSEQGQPTLRATPTFHCPSRTRAQQFLCYGRGRSSAQRRNPLD